MEAKSLTDLRDFRDSLLSGLLWIGTLVALFARAQPSSKSSPGVSAGLERVAAYVGSTTVVFAFVALAIVTGEIWTGLFTRATFRLSLKAVRKGAGNVLLRSIGDSTPVFWPVSIRAGGRLRRLVASKLGVPPASSSPAFGDACMLTLQEMLYCSPRLMAVKVELYLEHVRLKSTSRFYDATAVPFGCFVASLALNLELPGIAQICICGVGLVSALALLRFARSLFRDAHSVLVHALADGMFSSTTLDNWPP